jgi:hypothetical protein
VEDPPPRLLEWERDLRARLVAGHELALAECYRQFSPMVLAWRPASPAIGRPPRQPSPEEAADHLRAEGLTGEW